jgi:hypothetical protein
MYDTDQVYSSYAKLDIDVATFKEHLLIVESSM